MSASKIVSSAHKALSLMLLTSTQSVRLIAQANALLASAQNAYIRYTTGSIARRSQEEWEHTVRNSINIEDTLTVDTMELGMLRSRGAVKIMLCARDAVCSKLTSFTPSYIDPE